MLYNYFYNKNGRTFSWIFFIHVYNRVFETFLNVNYTRNSDGQQITQETVMVNKLHKKQWWSTNYTRNSDGQQITQETGMVNKLHKKQWWSTNYTRNSDGQQITQETVMVNKLHKKQWWSTNQIITLIIQTEYIMGGSHDCDCMVVGFTTTYAFSAYHH